ncbi:AIF_collapsed_G0031880.mRNA.1.CDS.1 [Saccharomyces cerevisiae]|nr:AIF_collapsed_G0031880.mRNA.1.CDS.1 [Saccharomyces cerevisiae]
MTSTLHTTKKCSPFNHTRHTWLHVETRPPLRSRFNTEDLDVDVLNTVQFSNHSVRPLHGLQMALRSRNVKWILDPVLGDNGGCTWIECVAVYQTFYKTSKFFSHTNQFEMELLVGMSGRTLDDAKQAFKLFHKSTLK